MATALSFGLAPLLALLAGACVYFLRDTRAAIALAIIAFAFFLAGRLVAHGERAALQRIERQNNEAVRKGRDGGDRVRTCSDLGGVWDVSTGKCLGVRAGGGKG